MNNQSKARGTRAVTAVKDDIRSCKDRDKSWREIGLDRNRSGVRPFVRPVRRSYRGRHYPAVRLIYEWIMNGRGSGPNGKSA